MVTAPPQPDSDLAVGVRADTYQQVARNRLIYGISATVLLAVIVAMATFTGWLPVRHAYFLGGFFTALTITCLLDAVRYARKVSLLRVRLINRRYLNDRRLPGT